LLKFDPASICIKAAPRDTESRQRSGLGAPGECAIFPTGKPFRGSNPESSVARGERAQNAIRRKMLNLLAAAKRVDYRRAAEKMAFG
jgi:hypothetical protein